MEIVKKLFSKKNLLIVTVFYFIIHIYTYYEMKSSEAFNHFCDYARENVSFTSKYGFLNECSLIPFNYRLKLIGSRGSAYFSSKITTNKGDFKFRVELKRENGRWNIVEAKKQE